MPTDESQPSRSDTAKGTRKLWEIDAHKKNILAVGFSTNGDKVATASADGTVKLWSTEDTQLLATFRGDGAFLTAIAFSSSGELLAAAGADGSLNVWQLSDAKRVLQASGHTDSIRVVKFLPHEPVVVTGGKDGAVRFWDISTGKSLRNWRAHEKGVLALQFAKDGQLMLTTSRDRTIRIWDIASGDLKSFIAAHDGPVNGLAVHPSSNIFASAGGDRAIKIWDTDTGLLLLSLESHTHVVDAVAFSPDGQHLASKGRDDLVMIWDTTTWNLVAQIHVPSCKEWWIPALAFHPLKPVLVTAEAVQKKSTMNRVMRLSLWELDYSSFTPLAGRKLSHHTTAKIVLVGDSGVGKTSLGWRLSQNEFKEHSSTHGQQFWLLNALNKKREDETECEAVLWDLAGQPDYRLIHALFLDDADLALVLFDPTDIRDPLRGAEYWIRHLTTNRSQPIPTLLVAARIDRGDLSISAGEITSYCRNNCVCDWLKVSAKEGTGIDELLAQMKTLIPWDNKPATITTATFKRIKEIVLKLKETKDAQQFLPTLKSLAKRIKEFDTESYFTTQELETAISHLENYGYVVRLDASNGKVRILLAPDLLNNLASSFVLEARRHQHELGSLEEGRIKSHGYAFRELEGLSEKDQSVMTEAATLLFLKNNIAFRETDPLTGRSFLVFPELIKLKKPPALDAMDVVDGPSYLISGAVENVYASLVVLLGYTEAFTRRDQWQNHARYQVGDGSVCGLRQDLQSENEIEFTIYFGMNVDRPIRTLFQGLFETLLLRRNLTVARFAPIKCTDCGSLLERVVVRTRIKEGKPFAFCSNCGRKLIIPHPEDLLQKEEQIHDHIEDQRAVANARTKFEEAVFRLQAIITNRGEIARDCFISYAWGNGSHERWVEHILAKDLQKAGITVILDRWENSKIGASVPRFIERIEKASKILVVGTTLYRTKYENRDPAKGYVVAAEVDLISNRLIGTEVQKLSVLPLLLEGEKEQSLPPLLHGRVNANFTAPEKYFASAFAVILSVYDLPTNDPRISELCAVVSNDEESAS